MGGADKVKRQHDAGRLTVRERIDALLDPGSFHEVGELTGQAEYEGAELKSVLPTNFVMGRGRIDGRPTVVGGDDFTVRGGAADASIFQKQVYAEQMANELRIPIVRLIDGTGGGGSVKSLESMGRTYVPFNPGWDVIVDNLSTVPVVSLALGPVAGLGAARVVTSHYSVMVKEDSQVFVAGPPVVARLGETVDKEGLGGSRIHARNGVVDDEVDSETAAFDRARSFLSYLPPSVHSLADRSAPPGEALDGWPVAVLAGDPMHYGAGWTAEASQKVTRFVDLADTFHLPVVHLVDQPGFVIGTSAEKAATIRHGARTLAAIYQAATPWCSVILRKVFGVAGAAHRNHSRFSIRYAWPSGDWGSLPMEGGIEAAFKADLEAADDPDALLAEIRAALDAFRSPYKTAEAFLVEEIIDPRDTRRLLCEFANLAAPLRQPGRIARGTRP